MTYDSSDQHCYTHTLEIKDVYFEILKKKFISLTTVMSHLVSTERSSDDDDDDFQSKKEDDENKDDKGDEFHDNDDSHNSDDVEVGGDDVGNVGDDNGGGDGNNMGIDGGDEITEEQELLQQIQELTLEGQVEDLDESDSVKIKIHEYVYVCFLFNRRNALAKKASAGRGVESTSRRSFLGGGGGAESDG